jgi:hypothetical protein
MEVTLINSIKIVMKIVVLITIFILKICNISHCQISKNNWLVGGNLSYSKVNSAGTNASNNKTTTIEIMPNIGYFIFDKLAVGIKQNTHLSKEKRPQVDGSTNTFNQNNFSFGPFIRYYFLDIDNRVNVFSDFSGYYTFITNRSNGIRGGVSKSIDYSIFAGSALFVNSTVGLEFLLGYTGFKDIENESRSDKIQFRIGLQIHLEKK